MKIKILLLFALFLQAVNCQSNLYHSTEFKNTLKMKTRTIKGVPGANYWVNSSDYKISATIDTDSRILSGEAEIKYYNNSPDHLEIIIIRLYQDYFKKGGIRDYQSNPKAINEGVKIEKIEINNNVIDLNDKNNIVSRYGTNLYLTLEKSLKPGSSINLKINWEFIIPFESRIRMGAYDNSTYFVGYWYPQIAVYDDFTGWDNISYSGQNEFYNDFNNYEVEITMPEDHIVWATGLLQNPEDCLSKKYLERYNKALSSDEIIAIIDSNDIGDDITFDDDITWKFKAENVPDFAFATSSNYLWDATNLKLDSSNVFISSAYKKISDDFFEVAQISKDYIKYASEEIPGVAYPYPSMTVFNGHGGMEFPMMCNDGSTSSFSSTVGLTSHEIAHTYFPFYMGTNETLFAFMDEGWAVMLPFDFQSDYGNYDPLKRNIIDYENSAGSIFDLPLISPSYSTRDKNYRQSAYRRPGIAYMILRDLLGDEMFKKCLKEYIKRWNSKHPLPYDFFYTFNEVSGKNLNWFWEPWFFEFGYPDLSIANFEKESNVVTIRKLGNIPVPVAINVIFTDNTEEEYYADASVWKDGNNFYSYIIKENKEIKLISIGNFHIPDINRENNILKIK